MFGSSDQNSSSQNTPAPANAKFSTGQAEEGKLKKKSVSFAPTDLDSRDREDEIIANFIQKTADIHSSGPYGKRHSLSSVNNFQGAQKVRRRHSNISSNPPDLDFVLRNAGHQND